LPRARVAPEYSALGEQARDIFGVAPATQLTAPSFGEHVIGAASIRVPRVIADAVRQRPVRVLKRRKTTRSMRLQKSAHLGYRLDGLLLAHAATGGKPV
jgi:hypothetical protein